MKIIFAPVACFLIFTSSIIAQNDSLNIRKDSISLLHKDLTLQDSFAFKNIHTGYEYFNIPRYFSLLASDFKQDITAPFHLTQKQWLQTGIYAGAILTLQGCSEYFDEPIQKFALMLDDSSKSIATISSYATHFGGNYELFALAALGGYGVAFNNKKLLTTTLLASQAYITSGLIENGIKYLSGRQRPSYYTPGHTEAEPTYHGPGFLSNNHFNSSFPSGHTTVAFAVATVFAKEYRNITWVPITAYSVASLVGLSRLTQNKHWATDIIVGATLGYLCGNQVVNNFHRHAQKISYPDQGHLTFSLNYYGNTLEPGLVYTFRK